MNEFNETVRVRWGRNGEDWETQTPNAQVYRRDDGSLEVFSEDEFCVYAPGAWSQVRSTPTGDEGEGE